jgi:hypothetical protein
MKLLETCFCVFTKKIDLEKTSRKLLEMLLERGNTQDSYRKFTKIKFIFLIKRTAGKAKVWVCSSTAAKRKKIDIVYRQKKNKTIVTTTTRKPSCYLFMIPVKL